MKIRTELTFPGELKEEAIVCNICKQFDLTVNIVEASFSTDTGWSILIFKGSDGEIKKAFEYLKTRGVDIKDAQEVA